MTDQNCSAEDVIQAVFTASDEAKSKALAILEGNEPEPEDSGSPLLVNMGDGASLLGVSRSTLWRMIRNGRLQKCEIYPGAFRLRRSDLLALVNGEVAHA